MSTDLVTVATFDTAHDAHVSRNKLEEHGIRAFLADEMTIGMASHYSPMLGGVKLQVAETDIKRAVSILENYNCRKEIVGNRPTTAEAINGLDANCKPSFWKTSIGFLWLSAIGLGILMGSILLFSATQ